MDASCRYVCFELFVLVQVVTLLCVLVLALANPAVSCSVSMCNCTCAHPDLLSVYPSYITADSPGFQQEKAVTGKGKELKEQSAMKSWPRMHMNSVANKINKLRNTEETVGGRK